MTNSTKAGESGSTGTTGARARRWAGAVAAGAAVVGLVVAVQVATGGGPDGAGVGGSPADTSLSSGGGSAPPSTGDSPPSSPADAGEATVDLFGTPDGVDLAREMTMDAAAGWPVAGCAAVASAEVGRVDFVSGSESGPEYSRELAIGWYADEAAATAAYDALVVRIAECAGEEGSAVETGPAALGATAATAVVTRPTDGGASATALSTVSRSGSVVVLATDHGVFYPEGPAPADGLPAVTANADRLLGEACRVAPDSC